ncbi:MAG TPA: CHAT domain-containing protein [Blastocatellia bacterium]|nr:CHAT domain-containing protein [Blastocatellia bacterium]
MNYSSCAKSYRSITFLNLVIAVWSLTTAHASNQQSIPALEEGRSVERELAGGETHAFQVALAAGQYLRVVVDQRGIDVALKIFGTDGRDLAEMDSPNATQGPEAISVIAEQTGDYRVEISSRNKAVLAGRYEAKVAAIRTATEQDRKWIAAQSAYNEGQGLRGKRDLRRSIESYQEAIRNWQAVGDRLMETHALYCIAYAWNSLSQKQKALENFNQALRLLQPEGGREEANTLYRIGIIQNDLSEPRQALDRLERALSMQQVMGDVHAEAQTSVQIGRAHLLLGEPRKSLEFYKEPLALWRKLGDRTREALTLHNSGRAYEDLGEYQKAMEHYFQALTLHKAQRDRRGEAEELNSIGYINIRLGEWNKVLEYCGQALSLWVATEDHEREAYALSNIGVAYASLKEIRKALDHYHRALNLHRETHNRRYEAVTLEDIGDLHATSADYRKALEYYEQSLQLQRNIGNRWGEASVLCSIGLTYSSLGAAEKAMEYFNQSLSIYRILESYRRGEARALYGLARVERDRGNLIEARRRIEAALSLVESARADAGGQELRASYLALAQKYYEFYVDTLMRLHRLHPAEGFDAEALKASERARARSLLELLAESRVNIRQGVDVALLDRERNLAQQLNAKAQRQMELTGEQNSEAQLAEIKKEISALEDEYNQVGAAIRKNSPRYSALTQPEPLSLKEIRQQTLGDGVLLLEYALGEERSYLWAVTNESITSYELSGREQINKAAREVTDLLTARSLLNRGETPPQRRERIAQADALLPEAAKRLSEMVLGPVADQLGNKRLIIVPDEALQYVPFAMLPEPAPAGQRSAANETTNGRQAPIADQQPLVVNHEIISLPSASTLAVLRRELAGRKPAPRLLAVIADPVFTLNDDRFKSKTIKIGERATPETETSANTRIIEHLSDSEATTVSSGRLRIPRLPFTRQEAERILATAPAGANLKALGFRANRGTATRAELGRYRYLHFATHGLLDSERPTLSALVLSLVDERGAPQDGFLRAHEIYNLNLPAELVVLSACRTGLGKDIKGEGLVGLTRGFMYAGAARVVVSLWSVNDKATSELMSNFYQKIFKDGQSPAAALRSAQVEMWRQRQWQTPYYWAAFILQGEWR